MILRKEEKRMDYRTIYNVGTRILSDLPDGKLDARLLLEEACGTGVQTLLAHPERPVSEKEEALYRSFLERRRNREPVAYILGHQEFMGLDFSVSPSVLIPNQDTETLAEEALRGLKAGDRILDLCTGSGCILLSLLHYCPGASGIGTDLSREALAAAAENGIRMGLEKRAAWKPGDLFEALKDTEDELSGTSGTDALFDIIVSNPPYIKTEVIETLEPEVKSREPYMALDGGIDGLIFYRRIADQAAAYLKKGGRLLVEIGYDQGKDVSDLLKEKGFTDVRIIKDYADNDRVVSAYLPETP